MRFFNPGKTHSTLAPAFIFIVHIFSLTPYFPKMIGIQRDGSIQEGLEPLKICFMPVLSCDGIQRED